MKINNEARNAIFIGTLCSIAYFAVYIARNILSAVSPQMIESGFSEEYIGKISSVFFIAYAIGQLVNGAIGEKIKTRYMLSLGLVLAGVCSIVVPFVDKYKVGMTIAYGMTGFFLAMIFGPITKVVAENTEPKYATRCTLGYTFSSFFGSPMAGLLAVMISWQGVFVSSGITLIVIAILVFIFFLILEKTGIVKYNQFKTQHKGTANIKILLKRQIVKYMLISVLTGIVRTSVVFWLPTYISQYLEFSAKKSAGIFTIATFVISLTPFAAVFLYERLKCNLEKTVLVMFASSTVFFVGVYLVKYSSINIILIVLAIMASNGAASMLWSRYCPSLMDTGMVSTVTGFLEFLSYMAAALANVIFANAVLEIGWSNLILVWTALMAVGVIISLPFNAWVQGKGTRSK